MSYKGHMEPGKYYAQHQSQSVCPPDRDMSIVVIKINKGTHKEEDLIGYSELDFKICSVQTASDICQAANLSVSSKLFLYHNPTA